MTTLKQPHNQSEPLTAAVSPTSKLIAIAAVVGATLIYVMIAWLVRGGATASPLAIVNENGFRLDPYFIGIAVQELILPIALLYLFSNSDLFKRYLTKTAQWEDEWRLITTLAGMQVLVFLYSWGLNLLDQNVSMFGLLLVVVGGLLGGWRVGVVLGVLTMLLQGSMRIYWGWMVYLSEADRVGLTFRDMIWWGGMFHVSVLAAVWAGIAVGYGRDLLGRWRFRPWALLLLALLLEGIPAMLTLYAYNDTYAWQGAIPSILVSGFAFIAFGLIATSVRGAQAQRQAEVAQLALAQAELRALRAQINPHFLFNSLNTIRYFVRTDPESARRLLINLSDVFQSALKSGEFIALSDEIHYTKAYLALEQARLDERLVVNWFVQSDSLLEQPLPTLLLQPIVENAVVHGIAPKPEGGTIQITISRGKEQMTIQVVDNGTGIPPKRLEAIRNPDDELEGSIGLKNIFGRLQALYGRAFEFTIDSTPFQGTTVLVKLPLQREADDS